MLRSQAVDLAVQIASAAVEAERTAVLHGDICDDISHADAVAVAEELGAIADRIIDPLCRINATRKTADTPSRR